MIADRVREAAGLGHPDLLDENIWNPERNTHSRQNPGSITNGRHHSLSPPKNPHMKLPALKRYIRDNFEATQLLDFEGAVEEEEQKKRVEGMSQLELVDEFDGKQQKWNLLS
jgi:hypothetical protein